MGAFMGQRLPQGGAAPVAGHGVEPFAEEAPTPLNPLMAHAFAVGDEPFAGAKDVDVQRRLAVLAVAEDAGVNQEHLIHEGGNVLGLRIRQVGVNAIEAGADGSQRLGRISR